MGLGIWSMHYIGMLAFRLPVTVLYDWPTVLLSLLAAIFSAAVALFVVSRQRMGWLSALTGSAIMGSGIATMHYTGMAAMRLPAMCSYDPLLVILSVVVAIVISLVALWLTFRFREDTKAAGLLRAASAIVMGAAIPVMHYTGMAAARFTFSPVSPDISHAWSTSTLSIAGVSAVTAVILSVAVVTSAVGRRFSAQTFKLREHERRVLTITQTAPTRSSPLIRTAALTISIRPQSAFWVFQRRNLGAAAYFADARTIPPRSLGRDGTVSCDEGGPAHRKKAWS